MFSALGGGGGVIIGTMAGYQDLCGGYHERIRGCSVHWGRRRDMSAVVEHSQCTYDISPMH